MTELPGNEKDRCYGVNNRLGHFEISFRTRDRPASTGTVSTGLYIPQLGAEGLTEIKTTPCYPVQALPESRRSLAPD